MATETEGYAADGGTRRACDQCRLRKVKCDKTSPCANCRIAKRSCSTSITPLRPREARQRVLISSQYERKVDHFDVRLSNIERLLQVLVNSPHENRADSRSREDGWAFFEPTLLPVTPPSTFNTAGEKDHGVAFEGNSSLTAHTAFANEFLEHRTQLTALCESNPNLRSALCALQQIVTTQKNSAADDESFSNGQALPKGGIYERPMPPQTLVLQILREIKQAPPVTLTFLCCFLTVDEVIEFCQKIYFATEKFNLATFIIVNGVLHYLFNEKALVQQDANVKAEYIKYGTICKENLEMALANLNLFMPARMENIQALLLGATHAIQISQPTLAWKMNCTVSQMCQTLGYHRLIPLSNTRQDDASYYTKLNLFRFAYMVDKSLSLKLGRVSAFRDHDIVIPTDTGETNASGSWRNIFGAWIRLAEIQGNVYDQLYSYKALLKPSEERAQCAYNLAEQIKALARDTGAMKEGIEGIEGPRNYTSEGNNAWQLTIKSEFVSYYSTLTLIYRAIPFVPEMTNGFHSECIQYARQALQAHMECMQIAGPSIRAQAAYIHWTILFSPFISFIIIFCHIIESSNVEDLKQLEDFATSLQPARAGSKAIEQIYRLAQVLFKIAVSYIEARKSQSEDSESGLIGFDFDLYLSQFGFMPSMVEHMPFEST